MNKSAGIPAPRRTFPAALGRTYCEPPSVFNYFVPIKTHFFEIFFRFQKMPSANGFHRDFAISYNEDEIELEISEITEEDSNFKEVKSYFKTSFSDPLLENPGHLK